ncbi:MAG: type II secretion system protein GspN [Bacteriovoracaceae bacterium]
MASSVEVHSLEEINYRPKIKIFLIPFLVLFVFVSGFINFYPIGDKIKTILTTQLGKSGCNLNFDQLRIEWLLPKVIVTDVTIPATCFESQGEAIKLNHLTLNFHLINFSPLGLPFRIDTDLAGQPISIYFVQGFGQQMIRMKDQSISLSKLEPLMGANFKFSGTLKMDLNLQLESKLIKSLDLKAASQDFQIPSQSVQGFTLPSLRINKFLLNASSEGHPRVNINQLFLGDPDSPIRANFKGRVNIQEKAIGMSALDLAGEVAFSESLIESFPLIDMLFQSFPSKDGFYQIRLGGTLNSPKPSAP